MFTGIIEAVGTIKKVTVQQNNKSFFVESNIFSELKIDQSIAHDGVCLTVERLDQGLHKVTAIHETLKKTNVDLWDVGVEINLERSLLPSSRLDGHFVQGHVDTTGKCIEVEDKNGSWELTFEFPQKFASLVIEKGSICINGISLTAFDITQSTLKVAIIPYTWEHTNLHKITENAVVNLEFDLIGKYILRKTQLGNE